MKLIGGERSLVGQLREAVRAEMARRPFVIDAILIMPDHIHAPWSLPVGDGDYPIRWRNIKPFPEGIGQQGNRFKIDLFQMLLV